MMKVENFFRRLFGKPCIYELGTGTIKILAPNNDSECYPAIIMKEKEISEKNFNIPKGCFYITLWREVIIVPSLQMSYETVWALMREDKIFLSRDYKKGKSSFRGAFKRI